MPSGQGENFPMNKNILALVAGLTLMPWLTATLRADFFGDLQPKLIESKNGKPVPYEAGETKPEFTAIYYSAHWCPPCRQFTPLLGEFFKSQAAALKFAVVFATGDRDEKSFKDYFARYA